MDPSNTTNDGDGMIDSLLLAALNAHLLTEDGTPVTAASAFYRDTLRDSIMRHNHSQADLLVQAFIGRYLLRSGERVMASLANKRMSRRESYPEIRYTLLEMMLVVAMVTLAHVLAKLSLLLGGGAG